MSHTLVHDEEPRHATPARMFQLGWSSFWLLGAILAGILGLVALVFLGLTRSF